ncbi:PTS system mannose/fructose/sorbose family transporter subunit IID [Streptococcus sanguinis]|uniref:PTS family mannose/fructose/sorbose porter component IID n=2 Tax=Streptococcus sanguinis TaxID=1305 RepID=F0HYV2_STRSA|nr:PTS system mannose/fructose/sorbose family transporter subunit IID [Streptococcus sanguinis]EGC24195.1 PTS system mannose/fructose/sorbose family IID component [Streptococcus sanguinis SK405]EGD30555.1 PTS family mannose/fructose/sorbose porter component IID [Streptococcus sanguinis SK72]MBZ2058073.1 PTS system mannose/fructose/sorbose family transporter subunit IID [Streptococcus sanguinis]
MRRISKMAERKKITKKTLAKSFHHWYYGHLTCFSQEHMQTFGYLTSMLPIVEELYKDKAEQKEAMQTYTAFFNTEPQLGALVVGITAGLEEARANGDAVDGETINGMRAGLMGPIAGIGDSLVVGTLIPVLLGIALGLSKGGNPIGALFYILVWNVLIYGGMRFAYFKGYELGDKAVEFLVGPKGQALRKAISVIGGMVIGAVAATWVSVTTSLELKNADGEAFLKLQEKIDGVYPGLLTAAFITLCWWLMAKKKVSPNLVMLLLVVIALIGVALGIFDPQLKY